MNLKYHVLTVLVILAVFFGTIIIVKFPAVLLVTFVGLIGFITYYVAYHMVRSFYEDY